MEDIFETKFNELQTAMVSVCLEYCKNRCDQLYIHIINENNTVFADFFFRIDGEMYKKSKISNDVQLTNPKRQQVALSEIINYVRKIFKLCNELNQPIPSEFKIEYNKNAGNFKAVYSYDKITSADKSDRYVSQKWFENLK